MSYYCDEDGSLVIRARLPAEEGAVVLQATNAAMDAQRVEESDAAIDNVTAVTSDDAERFARRAEEEAHDAAGDDVTAVTSENKPRSRSASRRIPPAVSPATAACCE